MKQLMLAILQIFFTAIVSSHEVYSELETQKTQIVTTFENLQAFASENYLLFFTMPGCSHCDDMKPEWEKVNLSENIQKMEVNCASPEQYQICKFFGIQRLPTVILAKEGNYYFLPGSITLREVAHIQNFAESEYVNAFIQGILTTSEPNITRYTNQAKRLMQQMMEENASGLATLGITKPNRVFLTIFTIGFFAFPFGIVYFILQWYCNKAQGPAQESLLKKEKELSELKLIQKKKK